MQRPRRYASVVLATVVLATAALAACSGDDPAPASDGGAGGTGDTILAVGVEQLDGALIEGFQLSIAVTDATGATSTATWDELVAAGELTYPGATAPPPEDLLGHWYTGLWATNVAPGPVTVTTELQLGMEAADPPCTTEVGVPEGETVVVRVTLLPGEGATTRDPCATVAG